MAPRELRERVGISRLGSEHQRLVGELRGLDGRRRGLRVVGCSDLGTRQHRQAHKHRARPGVYRNRHRLPIFAQNVSLQAFRSAHEAASARQRRWAVSESSGRRQASLQSTPFNCSCAAGQVVPSLVQYRSHRLSSSESGWVAPVAAVPPSSAAGLHATRAAERISRANDLDRTIITVSLRLEPAVRGRSRRRTPRAHVRAVPRVDWRSAEAARVHTVRGPRRHDPSSRREVGS